MATPLNVQSHKETPPAAGFVRVPLRDLLNLPNSLTLLRLFSIPLFLGLLGYRHYRAALWVFGFAALTDSLDGTVARWFDAKTELGSFLDPFADKLMLVSAFVVLTMDGDFPPVAVRHRDHPRRDHRVRIFRGGILDRRTHPGAPELSRKGEHVFSAGVRRRCIGAFE